MGTTPPSSESAGDHPSILRSQRSYPGTTQVSQSISTTASSTVPPSPTILQVIINMCVCHTNRIHLIYTLYVFIKLNSGTGKLFGHTSRTNAIVYHKGAAIAYADLLSIIQS